MGSRPTTTESSIDVENHLLRQQVQDMAGQLAVLMNLVRLIAQQTATPVIAFQAPSLCWSFSSSLVYR